MEVVKVNPVLSPDVVCLMKLYLKHLFVRQLDASESM